MVARTLARSRSSIGSNPASPASSAKRAVSVIWFMAFGPRLEPVAACGPHSPWRLPPPVRWVSVHPEITPPSNFHQLRDTTDAGLRTDRPERAGGPTHRDP